MTERRRQPKPRPSNGDLPDRRDQLHANAKSVAHVLVFLLSLAIIVKGGLLSSPADLGEIAAGTTLLGLVGIARA